MKYLIFLVALSGMACSTPADTASTEMDYQLVWSDEFNDGVTPDQEKWNYQLGDGCPQVCGWGNNELQLYTSEKKNVRQENGHLIIEAVNESGTYTSARLTTQGKGEWKQGRIVVRASLPTARGTWPAIWMLPAVDKLNWPEDGEIDIMEHVGYNNGTVYGTIHTEKYNHLIGTQKIDSLTLNNVTEFHEYILEWDAETLVWKVDNDTYHVLQRNGEGKPGWPFDQPFYLILNIAVGGNWGGKYGVDATAFPQQMKVDYVRVYQKG